MLIIGGVKTLALALEQASYHSRQIRAGIEEVLERSGDWQLFELPCSVTGAPPVRDSLETVDGLISCVDRRHRWLAKLAATGVPVVNCGAGWRGVPGIGIVGVKFDTVLDLVIRHFLEIDLKRMAFAFHGQVDAGSWQRLVGRIAETAIGYGIECTAVDIRGKTVSEDMRRLLKPEAEADLGAQLRQLKHPCGVFCEDDYVARLVCNVAAKVGLRVPTELAVLGSGDDLIGRYGVPSLSTVCLPGQQVGAAAFRMVLECLEGKGMPELVRVPASRLIVRESTGGKQRDIAMERVHRHIAREALRGLTVEELPLVAGLSLKALRKRYLSAHGEEPSAHIRRLRLTEARNLLAGSSSPVGTIATRCGFSSMASFSNFFLRHEGVAPAEYRAKPPPT